ncbi:MAG TPA: transcription antitermination factor NusB [Thermoflexia bacterium]|nr:transcription antitermination factor NusB [Thermoflexia bacterium]
MKARRRARALALQALYEIDSVGHPPDVVIEERLAETPLPESAAEFSRRLVFGVLRYRQVLDQFIQEHAPEWPVEQMACIDRNILRMALFEFAVDGTTPVKVAINEAVELAKMFGSDSSSRFVNGVLGALVPRKGAIARAVQEAGEE